MKMLQVPVLAGTLRRARSGGLGAVLLRGASGSFALNVAWAGLGFASQVLLARFMGDGDYGDFAVVFSWLMVITLTVNLGFDKSLLRFVAVYQGAKQWSYYRGILRYAYYTSLIASIAMAIAMAVCAWWVVGPERSGLLYTFWVAAMALPPLAVATLQQGAIQALRRPVQAQFGLLVFRPLALVAIAAIWWAVRAGQLHSYEGMTAYLLATVVVLALNTTVFQRTLPSEVLSARPAYAAANWFGMALPMMFMASMTMALRQVSVMMIGAMEGTTQAGYFAAANRLVDLVVFGLLAVNVIAAPIFAELHAGRRESELQRILTLSAQGIFALCVPVAVFLALSGRLMLRLYGSEFVTAYPTLIILLVGQVFKAFAGSVGYLMTMTGHQKTAALIVFVSALTNVALCALLIPRYGIEGAAIASAISVVIWNTSMLVYVVRRLGMNPTVVPLTRVLRRGRSSEQQ